MNNSRPNTTFYDSALSIYDAYAADSPDQQSSDRLENTVVSRQPLTMARDPGSDMGSGMGIGIGMGRPRYQLQDVGPSTGHHSGYSEEQLVAPSPNVLDHSMANRYGGVPSMVHHPTDSSPSPSPSPSPSYPQSRTTSYASHSPVILPQSPLQRAPPSSSLTYPASQLHATWPSSIQREEDDGNMSAKSPHGIGGHDEGYGTKTEPTHGNAAGDEDPAVDTLPYSARARRDNQERGVMRTTATGWRKFFPPSLPIRLFLLLVIIETVVNLGIQIDLLIRFDSAESRAGTSALDETTTRTMPVYLCIFGLAHLFQLVLAFDATVNRNTIQIIGLSVFNALFLAYAVIQMSEIRATLGRTADGQVTTGETANSILHVPVTVLTGMILGMIALAEVGFVVLSWFIYKEFGWETYKVLGANITIHRIHRQYQIFITMIRFSAFFFAGFGIQLIFLILQKTDAEYYVTIAMLPLSILILIEGSLAARFEWLWGMACFMFGLLAGCGYFAFKLFRIVQRQDTTYRNVFKSLSVFAALALVMLVLTFTWSIIVTNNFNKGLKQQLERARQRRRAEREGAGGTTPIKGVPWTDAKSTGHDDFEMGAKASRMSID